MGTITWIIFGLIAGAIAKRIQPGNRSAGWTMTIIIGILGAMLGGWLGSMIFGIDITGFNFSSLLIAIAGSVLLLFLYGKISSK